MQSYSEMPIAVDARPPNMLYPTFSRACSVYPSIRHARNAVQHVADIFVTYSQRPNSNAAQPAYDCMARADFRLFGTRQKNRLAKESKE